MTSIQFPEANVIFAKDQPEYQPLPALKADDEMGTVVTCWQLSPEELQKINETGVVWLGVYTFNKPIVPLLLSVNKSDFINEPESPTLTESKI